MIRARLHFAFLNAGHLIDHMFMLVFATVAALALAREWGMEYAQLIPYATPGFIAFGLFSIPAGWLADKWSRQGMMTVFFIGIGIATALTGLAQTPVQIAAGLFAIGVFAAIYHPVGLALVIEGRQRTGMALALNGVFGNFGTAGAALLAGLLIDASGWRSAFFWPGALSVAVGLAYWATIVRTGPQDTTADETASADGAAAHADLGRKVLLRVFAVIFVSTAIGGVIYQSTTFAMPKVFDERLAGLAASASEVGLYVFGVFTIAAAGQLAVGYLIDRVSIRTVFAVIAALQAVFAVVLYQLSGMAALIACTVLMMAVFGQIPINDVLVGRLAHSQWRSRVYALRYIVTFTAMALAVPLIAWIHAVWDFATLFLVLAGAAVVTLSAVLALPRVRAITGGAAQAADCRAAD